MTEPGRGGRLHEPDEVPAGRLGLVLAAAGAFVALSGLLVWVLLVTVWKPAGNAIPAFGAAAEPAASPPTGGRVELETLIRAEEKRLDSYGWVDRKRGVVHIPIGEAMERMVRGSHSDEPSAGAGRGEGGP